MQKYPANLTSLPIMLNDIRNEINIFVHDAKQQRRLELCTEEILVNIIEYAYPNIDGSLYISVEYIMEIKQLRFTFYDEGIPYNPLLELSEHNKVTSLEEQPIGGLGIFLYTTIMDGAEYKYINNKNQLTVWKNLN